MARLVAGATASFLIQQSTHTTLINKLTLLAVCLPAALHGQSISGLQETVRERTGHEVEWTKDAETDGQVERAVHALLRRPLTAERAVQIALLNNRELQATFEEMGIAQADLIEAGLLKNPVFEGSARFPDRPPGAADVELSVAQDFLDLLMLPLRKKIAAQELARAELRAGDAVLKLAAETKRAFYELQAQQQLLAEMNAFQATETAARELSGRLHDAGNISDLELANQQAASSQAKLEALALEVEWHAGRERMNRLLGLAGDEEWKLTDELPTLPANDLPPRRLEALALAQRLDLAATKAEWAGVVQALGISRTYRYLGTVELGVDTESQPDRQRITGPVFRLELPIFNRGQGRIARMEAQLRQTERRVEAQAIGIRAEVREARDRVEAERKLVVYYRDELLPERKKVLDLTVTHYNAMLKGGYDLLLAKQNELAAQRGAIEALRDYWMARSDLERAIGGRTTRHH